MNAEVRRLAGLSRLSCHGSTLSSKFSLKTGVCSLSVLLGLSSSRIDEPGFGEILFWPISEDPLFSLACTVGTLDSLDEFLRPVRGALKS